MQQVHKIANLLKSNDLTGLLQFLNEIPANTQFDYKIRFSTYTFYKANQEVFEIDYTGDGWQSTKLSPELLVDFLSGKISSLDLSWS